MAEPARAFDYATLADPAERTWLRQQTQQIAVHMEQAARGILEAGRILCEIKRRLGHGRFKRWVETEFPQCYESAVLRMHAWKTVTKMECHSIFTPDVLNYVCGPSYPRKAREEFIGEAIALDACPGMARARELARSHRPPPRAAVLKLAEHLAESGEPEPTTQPDGIEELGSLLQRGAVEILRTEDDESGGETFRVRLSGANADIAEPHAEGVTLAEAIGRLLRPSGEVLRVCTRCRETRPIGAFSRLKRGPGGRNWSCKGCESKRASAGKKKRKRGAE